MRHHGFCSCDTRLQSLCVTRCYITVYFVHKLRTVKLIGQRHFGHKGRVSSNPKRESVSEGIAVTCCLAYASGYNAMPKWRCPIRQSKVSKSARREARLPIVGFALTFAASLWVVFKYDPYRARQEPRPPNNALRHKTQGPSSRHAAFLAGRGWSTTVPSSLYSARKSSSRAFSSLTNSAF